MDSTELTPEELDRLVALREAATKGPWSESFRGHSVEVNQSGGENIAILHLNEPSLLYRQAESNAVFIAAVTNAFPALVAMARRGIELERQMEDAAYERRTRE